MAKDIPIVLSERIISRIFLIRSKKVMLDKDLAELYGVPTKVLNQAVKRNIERSPEDFMFQLNSKERKVILRSQIVTLEQGKYSKYFPLAFTEQGVAMLSSVLKSKQAIRVNIQIIRIFTKLRKILIHYKDLKEKIEKMENKYDEQFREVFAAIKLLIQEEQKPKKTMGFCERK